MILSKTRKCILQLYGITYRKEKPMKHNKKIISSRSALVLCSFSILMFWGLSLLPLGLVVFGESHEIGAALLLFSTFFGLGCFLLWFLNRAACVVWFEDGMIKRKGLIRGFYKECSVRAIQTVKTEYVHRAGTFIFLVDDHTPSYKKFFPTRKDSYICFRKTRKIWRFCILFGRERLKSESFCFHDSRF